MTQKLVYYLGSTIYLASRLHNENRTFLVSGIYNANADRFEIRVSVSL